MEKKKKKWEKPKLIVLTRESKGEAVLQDCKYSFTSLGAPDSAFTNCGYNLSWWGPQVCTGLCYWVTTS